MTYLGLSNYIVYIKKDKIMKKRSKWIQKKIKNKWRLKNVLFSHQSMNKKTKYY